MEQSIRYQRAGIFRRVCSSLFDLIIFIFVFLLVHICISTPIVFSNSDYQTSYDSYKNICLSSNLIKASDDGFGGTTLEYDTTDEALTKFFNDNTLGYTLNDYNELKAKEVLKIDETDYYIFKYNSETNLYEDAKSEDATIDAKLSVARNEFYQKSVLKYFKEFFDKDTSLHTLSDKLTGYTNLAHTIDIIIATCVTFLLFPMIFKDRASLGKKMFHFHVVNERNGQIATRFQYFTRFVYFSVLYVALISFVSVMFGQLLGILTFIGLSAISLLAVGLSPKRATIHDMLAHTLVVNNDITNPNISEIEMITIKYDDGNTEEETGEVIDGDTSTDSSLDAGNESLKEEDLHE